MEHIHSFGRDEMRCLVLPTPAQWVWVRSIHLMQNKCFWFLWMHLLHCRQTSALVQGCVHSLLTVGPGFSDISPAPNQSWKVAMLFEWYGICDLVLWCLHVFFRHFNFSLVMQMIVIKSLNCQCWHQLLWFQSSVLLRGDVPLEQITCICKNNVE